MNVNGLAIEAVRQAARLRADHGVGPGDPVCPFDLAQRAGVSVRIVALPSLEGMYAPVPQPTIFVSAERPAGRRRYTGGHELGHHVFGHGMRLDELTGETDTTWSPEEYLAHRFSAALLMPKLAVEAAFARRRWSVTAPRAEDVFVIAQELGVGYVTLIGHLERTLQRLAANVASSLRKATLPKIRARLAGFEVENDLVVADEHWGSGSIDLEVGDVLTIPPRAMWEGTCVAPQAQPAAHLVAVTAGVGTVVLGSRRAPTRIRVSRRGFTGLARYRHLEEAGEDE